MFAYEQLRLDVDDRRGARPDDESVRAGQALRIEQAIDRQFFCRRFRPLDPEFDKAREFFARDETGVDRKAACRQAVALFLAQDTEVAGAEEYGELVFVSLRVQRVMNAEAGIAEAAHLRGIQLVCAVVEEIRVEWNFTLSPIGNLNDPYRLIEIKAAVKKRQFEEQILLAPIPAFRAKADVRVLVVGKFLQILGQVRGGLAIRICCKFAGAVGNVGESERQRGRRHRQQHRPEELADHAILRQAMQMNPPAYRIGPGSASGNGR